MTVRDIVKLSSTMLELNDVLNLECLNDETFNITKEYNVTTEDEKNCLVKLVRCFNNVYTEIATDYLSLVKIENITVESGSFDLTNLSNKFYKFIKLLNEFGEDVRCEIYDEILYVKNGKYRLYYCYVPEFATLNDKVNNFNGRVTERVFALGLNKEFCYMNGMLDEANFYRNEFERSLEKSYGDKKNIVLPKRRWF